MTDITTYPLEDGFETTLSQVWNGAVGTIYVNDTPSFTFPAGVTTYIVVDPGKSTMQLAEINAYDSSLKTITVSSISVNKGASVAYTQQSHQIGANVRISHNYQFWKDMIDGINSKMNTNSDDLEVGKFADAAARDAYRPTPVNGYSAYLIDVGYWTDYQSGNRVQRASGGSFSNATESISGGTEIGTTAEVTAGTAIGGTGASLSVTPAKLAAQIQSGSYISLASATDSGTDTYVTTATPTLTAYTTGALFVVTFAETNTTTTPTLNIDGLGAVTITDKDSVALAVGDITTNKLILMKVGSAFKIMSELPATATKRGIMYDNFQKYNFFGDGSDGDVTISSNTTLASDKFYNNLTINNGFTLNPGGYRIFVKGTLTNNGTIARNGNNGANGTTVGGSGGAALLSGTVYGSAAGGLGASNGVASTGPTPLGNGQGVAGGNGGNGNAGVAGSLGATVTQERIVMGLEDSTLNTFLFDNGTDTIKNTIVFKGITSGYAMIGSGSGGGGGAPGSSFDGGGGGGGSAGGVVYISALAITNNGTISSNGGNGGNGGSVGGAYDGGGGGGGGGGGPVLLIYKTLSNSGTITSTGGSGGALGTGGASNGTAGTAGASNAICKIVII